MLSSVSFRCWQGESSELAPIMSRAMVRMVPNRPSYLLYLHYTKAMGTAIDP